MPPSFPEITMLAITVDSALAVMLFAFLAGFFWTAGAWLLGRLVSGLN